MTSSTARPPNNHERRAATTWGTLVLTRTDVETLLSPDACRAAVEEAFRAYGSGDAAPPSVLGVRGAGGGFHIKAGFLRRDRQFFAAKVNGNFAGNPALGLARIQGVAFDAVASRAFRFLNIGAACSRTRAGTHSAHRAWVDGVWLCTGSQRTSVFTEFAIKHCS